ncbi:MAG: GH32 C-terminal domain-containing protein [Betaproteobacteria bacterium AqS2]|uniref:beta-fructofuranosidase n=1 Tax=Candidatus Amphirhobacter heronislandensis TaxID=1732024 RepID=A0A930UHS2_9GAMM|nr:GH32 C-terminal domain-containing protein [Betaproteobacteria bacterium AqS2]
MSAKELRAPVTLAPGEVVELWVRATGPGAVLRVERGGATVYEVPQPATHVEFHRFATDGGEVEVVWTPELLEVSFAYSYRPAEALAEGITLWEFEKDGVKQLAGKELAEALRAEPGRPQLHFSAPRQWMNDPNGLCWIDGRWHLFYQFHPGSVEWGPMHWGHAVSDDLVAWTHLPVFLHPQHDLPRLGASGGAFSGCAFECPDGKTRFCHTERLPCYAMDDFREVQRVVESSDLLVAAGGRTVLEQRPAAAGMDFRDPRVWWHAPAGAYRMVLGGAIAGGPAVLLYGSTDLASWEYLGPLWRADPKWQAEGAAAAECPDFFELDGRWVLLASMYKHADPKTGRRNPILAVVGEFKDDVFTPAPGRPPQVLDFGSDFYAMQSCAGAGRRIAFGWLHNWTSTAAAPDARHRGEQSWPRELSWDGHGQLRMAPARELDDAAKVGRSRIKLNGDKGELPDAPFEFRVRNIRDGMTTFSATAGGAAAFRVEAGCEDRGSPTRASIILPGGDECHGQARGTGELRIIYDRGIIEVFAAGGSCCGTRRIHPERPPDRFELNVASGQGELWRLEPAAP